CYDVIIRDYDSHRPPLATYTPILLCLDSQISKIDNRPPSSAAAKVFKIQLEALIYQAATAGFFNKSASP
ncbi:hypothetical protein, partial [Pseudomonas syringae]|uniref:hypothetical protein n=1 Tax=Pseudomonas syringae TaxID=317 RepID=UPI001F291FA5